MQFLIFMICIYSLAGLQADETGVAGTAPTFLLGEMVIPPDHQPPAAVHRQVSRVSMFLYEQHRQFNEENDGSYYFDINIVKAHTVGLEQAINRMYKPVEKYIDKDSFEEHLLDQEAQVLGKSYLLHATLVRGISTAHIFLDHDEAIAECRDIDPAAKAYMKSFCNFYNAIGTLERSKIRCNTVPLLRVIINWINVKRCKQHLIKDALIFAKKLEVHDPVRINKKVTKLEQLFYKSNKKLLECIGDEKLNPIKPAYLLKTMFSQMIGGCIVGALYLFACGLFAPNPIQVTYVYTIRL